MRRQLEKRLEKLKSEFVIGQKRFAELDAQRSALHETLLRISGAIQVLEEELGLGDSSPNTKSVYHEEVPTEETKLMSSTSLVSTGKICNQIKDNLPG